MRYPAPSALGVALGVLAVACALPPVTAQAARQRLRPPQGFACAPNDLTVYTGIVTRYTRDAAQTTLRIRTDSDTTEDVTVRYGDEGPEAHYRHQGQAFTNADWARIESSRGVLRRGVRASAWVCAGGGVLVDWNVAKE